MTKTLRTHYADRDTKVGTMSLCGMLARVATRTYEDVTCHLCLRRLEQGPPFAPSELVEETPWTPPPEMEARIGARRLSDADQLAIEDSRRGARARPLFASMGQALEAFVTARIDGYGGGSVSGSYEALHAMGTLIQHQRRGSTSTTRQAESVAEVSKALRFVFGQWTGEQLDERQALGAFLLMEVGKPIVDRSVRRSGQREWSPRGGWRAWSPMKASEIAAETDLTVSALGSLRKWARRRVRVELVARTLLLMPSAPTAKEDADRFEQRLTLFLREMNAIAARRGEMRSEAHGLG